MAKASVRPSPVVVVLRLSPITDAAVRHIHHGDDTRGPAAAHAGRDDKSDESQPARQCIFGVGFMPIAPTSMRACAFHPELFPE